MFLQPGDEVARNSIHTGLRGRCLQDTAAVCMDDRVRVYPTTGPMQKREATPMVHGGQTTKGNSHTGLRRQIAIDASINAGVAPGAGPNSPGDPTPTLASPRADRARTAHDPDRRQLVALTSLRRHASWITPGSLLAEREGFEPSIHFMGVCSLSRGVPSTTRPSLRSAADSSKDSDPLPFRVALSSLFPVFAVGACNRLYLYFP